MFLNVVRYGIPVALLAAGTVLALVSDETVGPEAWAMFSGAAISIVFLNVLFRIGVQGERERDREEAARRYFDEHGHWPDER